MNRPLEIKKMEPPLISVAMCTYNGARYIKEQIESILQQTFNNLEIIIIDDNSSDDTFEILSAYSKKYSFIKIFKNETNIGFNKNFEKAISLTSGDFIALSDQDDIWLPEKLELLYNAIGTSSVVCSNSALIDESGKRLGKNLYNKPFSKSFTVRSILLHNIVTGHTVLFKRSFISKIFPIPKESFYDWHIGFVALYYGELTYLDMPLTEYRVHPESVIQQKIKHDKNTKQLKQLELLDEDIKRLEIFSSYPFIQEEERFFILQLLEAIKIRRTKFSFSFFRLVLKHFPVLYPHETERKGLRLVRYAYRKSRKI